MYGEDMTVGPYRLVAPLGAGATAQVWRAFSPDGYEVAVKVLHPVVGLSAAMIDAAKREAKITEQLRSPHVARLLDYDLDGDPGYLAFQLVDGSDVTSFVKHGGPVHPSRVGSFLRDTAQGVADLHQAAVIHRDINPNNIMITPMAASARCVIVDLGIARQVEAQTGVYTRQGAHTIPYSSPEQLDHAEPIGTATDVYSWASTVYFALTGNPPFGVDHVEAFKRITDRRELPPTDVLEPLGIPGLEDLLMNCWIATPGQRPSAERLLAVVNDLTKGKGGTGKAGTDPRISFTQPSVTMWGELGAYMRTFRRRRGISRWALARLADFPAKQSALRLFLYELGKIPAPRAVVRYYDTFCGSEPSLDQFYLFAKHDDVVRAWRAFGPPPPPYPLAGDDSTLASGEDSIQSTTVNKQFVYTLKLRNSGTVAWHNRRLQRYGPAHGPYVLDCHAEFPLADTDPGEAADVRIPVKAPGVPGRYTQRFKMVDHAGFPCFPTRPQGLIITVDVAARTDQTES